MDDFKELLKSDQNKYTVGEILDFFGTGSIIIALILVTFITSIPLPPWGGGFETIPGGILSIFLALQGLIGLEKLYMPNFIRNFNINIDFIKNSEHTQKAIHFIEMIIERDYK